jgi:hypothetical protein
MSSVKPIFHRSNRLWLLIFLGIITTSILEIRQFHLNYDWRKDDSGMEERVMLLDLLQNTLNCNSEIQCLEQAERKLSPAALKLVDKVQNILHCNNPAQCITMLENGPTKPFQNKATSSLSTKETPEVGITTDAQQKKKNDQRILAYHMRESILRSQRGPDIEYGETAPFVNNHPAFEPRMKDYIPKNEWRETTTPDLNIVGLYKAGTTHLYRLLQSHPRVTNFTYGKEAILIKSNGAMTHVNNEIVSLWQKWEPNSIHDFEEEKITRRRTLAQKTLYKSHEQLHEEQSARNITSRTLTVHGCLDFETVEMSGWYMRPLASRKKFFFLFRDPADWLWAAHNFWKQDGLDPNTRPNTRQWALANREYRSPELFHEFVASGNRTTSGIYFLNLRKWTVEIPRRLRAMVGNNSALFLRNEDMLPAVVDAPGGALDRISAFTGLNKAGFDKKYTTQIFNCNQRKGVGSASCGSERTSAYKIAGDRTMLSETRQLIYLQFWEECKVWAREFGIVYPDCLNVMEDSLPSMKKATHT